MLEGFQRYLAYEGKSENTIKSYIGHVEGFIKWHTGSFGMRPHKLQRVVVLDYISYLRSVKNVSSKTINAKVCALIKLNNYLVNKGIQDNNAISKRDKVQQKQEEVNRGGITPEAVEEFRQTILEHETYRDYVLVTVLAYGGLRISEALGLRVSDIDFAGGVLTIDDGVKNKTRRVSVDDAVMEVIGEYIKERKNNYGNSKYIFASRQREKLNRTRVNQIFNKHSNSITPSKLRHFYYSKADY
jgi:site-specific recombinase XerD